MEQEDIAAQVPEAGEAAAATAPESATDLGLSLLAEVQDFFESLMRPWNAYQLAIAAGLLLVNIVTWHGTLWASWPILFLAALAGFIWSRRRHGAVSRFGPPAILAATLLGINILSGAQTLWAQWPILAIAAVSFFRWSRRGPGNSRPPQ